LGGRETLWIAGLQLIGKHPLTGVGIGNAGHSIIQFLNIASNQTSESIHNPILLIWSETGLIGIILYLGTPISAAIAFMKQYLHYRNIDVDHPFTLYFAFVSSYFLGYLASWVKGGGAETAFAYFFMVALLLIPSGLDYDLPSVKGKNEARQVLQK
jgi:O-antigen ligase